MQLLQRPTFVLWHLCNISLSPSPQPQPSTSTFVLSRCTCRELFCLQIDRAREPARCFAEISPPRQPPTLTYHPFSSEFCHLSSTRRVRRPWLIAVHRDMDQVSSSRGCFFGATLCDFLGIFRTMLENLQFQDRHLFNRVGNSSNISSLRCFTRYLQILWPEGVLRNFIRIF